MNPRSPIVTILGHVDHGKTTLLDTIRKSDIAAKEHGGITQRIGAYEIQTDIKDYQVNKITFIDTPGHEAFTKLRSRGANIADIAILVVDAKDSLMPQTIESISHIKAAKIPFIVALNKMDLPDAKPEKVKIDLLKYDVQVEGKGGTVPAIGISAKTGAGVPELLETILLIAADKNLTYDPKASSSAYIIETKKDKRGVVASAIIKDGTLKVGDIVYNDGQKAKVRALISDNGQQLKEVTPSTPFEVLGFTEMPEVGTLITNTPSETASVGTSEETVQVNNTDFLSEESETKQLSLIIKAEAQGSLEAAYNTLLKNDQLKIVHYAVGEINKSDILLAKTTGAIVIGFNVKANKEVEELARQEKVVIKTYNIIYHLLEELEEVAQVMREKEEQQKYLKGEVKVLASFTIEQEKIFGFKVVKGKINLSDQVEVYREDKLIGKGKVVSLHMRAKSVQEVKKDQEGGFIIGPPLDIRVGDVVKSIS